MFFSLSPFAPESFVSRDGFGSPVPRQPAHLHTQAESGINIVASALSISVTWFPPVFRLAFTTLWRDLAHHTQSPSLQDFAPPFSPLGSCSPYDAMCSLGYQVSPLMLLVARGRHPLSLALSLSVYVYVYIEPTGMCVFVELPRTDRSCPVILAILCHSH